MALAFGAADAAVSEGEDGAAARHVATMLFLAVRGSGWTVVEMRGSSRHVHAALDVLGRIRLSEIPEETRDEITEAFAMIDPDDPFGGAERMATERDVWIEALQSGYLSRGYPEMFPAEMTRSEELAAIPAYRETMDRIIEAWREPDGVERVRAIIENFEHDALMSPWHEVLREMRALGLRIRRAQGRLAPPMRNPE